ncbi:putative RNA polymerase sigma factor FecI [Pseudomonas reidholzensis]|uniref:Putative RNA polymerase sigma factor FecI n=1 Tax=Pseudomonas reidholzensis TaxID=1785162 RepID=A0A383RVW8_9PSED|nr:sigma-70 family RNA polymerase sigma factor [Pseudomonas reidholzensis]SYX91055.1 putative RNA polymerase sigma factor FecI [Pseudomonas reidholzensis]
MDGASARESAMQRDFTTLYVDHHSWLQNWLYRRMRCRSDAADLAQDTFLRLFRTSNSPLAADLRQPRAYLATVAKRLMLNLHRRRSVEEAWLQTLAEYAEQTGLSVEERCLIHEALQAVDSMLHGLPPIVRRAFLLSQLEGHTYSEIAQMLNVTVRTVQRYLTQAMEQCMLLAMTDAL